MKKLAAQILEKQQLIDDEAVWDWIKDQIRIFIKSYQIQRVNWRTRQLKKLLKKKKKEFWEHKTSIFFLHSYQS